MKEIEITQVAANIILMILGAVCLYVWIWDLMNRR